MSILKTLFCRFTIHIHELKQARTVAFYKCLTCETLKFGPFYCAGGTMSLDSLGQKSTFFAVFLLRIKVNSFLISQEHLSLRRKSTKTLIAAELGIVS